MLCGVSFLGGVLPLGVLPMRARIPRVSSAAVRYPTYTHLGARALRRWTTRSGTPLWTQTRTSPVAHSKGRILRAA